MPFQTGIPGALARYLPKVDAVPGWQTHGSSSFNPAGVVGHHTAGPKTGDRPSLSVCVNGRPDLDGPLCNVFLPRGLTAAQQAPVVVAAGRANHAGEGGFRGLSGNSSVFGIEAEDDGTDGVWTDWQLWAYPRVVAGLLWLAGSDESWYCSHRTWAPTRKIDPTGIADSWMRNAVHLVFNPPPAPPPEPKEDEMLLAYFQVSETTRTFWVIDATGKRSVTGTAYAELKAAGVREIGGLSSATLGEFPSFREDGTDAGGTYNDIKAILANTTPPPGA